MAARFSLEFKTQDREVPSITREKKHKLEWYRRLLAKLSGSGPAPDSPTVMSRTLGQCAEGYVEISGALADADTVLLGSAAANLTAEATAGDVSWGEFLAAVSISADANAMANAANFVAQPAIQVAPCEKATLTFTTAAMAVGDVVHLDGVDFTYVTTAKQPETVAIGASEITSATNLASAIALVFGKKYLVTNDGAGVLTIRHHKHLPFMCYEKVDGGSRLAITLEGVQAHFYRMAVSGIMNAGSAIDVNGVRFTWAAAEAGTTTAAYGANAEESAQNMAAKIINYFGSAKMSSYNATTPDSACSVVIYPTNKGELIKIIEVSDAGNELALTPYQYLFTAAANYAKLTFSDVGIDTETVVVNGVTFTAETTPGDISRVKFLAGVSAAADASALAVLVRNYFGDNSVKVYDLGDGSIVFRSADLSQNLTLTETLTNATNVHRVYFYAFNPGPQGNAITIAEGTDGGNKMSFGSARLQFGGELSSLVKP